MPFSDAQATSSTSPSSVAEVLNDAHLPWSSTRGMRCTTVDTPLFPGDTPEVVAVERDLGAGFGLGECKARCAGERCSAVTHVAGAGNCYTYEGICVEESAEPNVVVYSRPVITNQWQLALNSYCEGSATQHDVRTEQECKALCLAEPSCAAASIYPNSIAEDLHSCYTVHSECDLAVSLYGGAVHFNPAYLPTTTGDDDHQSFEVEPSWGASVGWECTASSPRNITLVDGSGGDVLSQLPGTVLNTTSGASREECQDECAQEPTCTAFTYNTDTLECTVADGACNEVVSPGGDDVTTYYKPWGEMTSGESTCEDDDWVGPEELTFSECKALCAASDGCTAIAMPLCYLLMKNCTVGGSDAAQLPGDTEFVVTLPGAGMKDNDTGEDVGSAGETDDGTTDADELDNDRGTGVESTIGPLSTLVWVAVGFGILMMLALCVAFAFFLTDRRRAGYRSESQKGDTIETRELNLGDEEAGVPAQPVQIDSPPSFKPASPVGALAGGDKKMVALEGVDEHDSPASSPRAGSTGAESQRADETSRLTGDAADSADAASSKPPSVSDDDSGMDDLDDLLPSEGDKEERLSMPRRS